MGLGLFVWWLVVWDALLLLLFCWIGVDLFGDCLVSVGVCFVFVMFVGGAFGFGLVCCFYCVCFADLVGLGCLVCCMFGWICLIGLVVDLLWLFVRWVVLNCVCLCVWAGWMVCCGLLFIALR